jgi:hypothetical protein
MLRELNVVGQRYRAVLEALDGIPVIEVADRYGVCPPDSSSLGARYRAAGVAISRLQALAPG